MNSWQTNNFFSWNVLRTADFTLDTTSRSMPHAVSNRAIVFFPVKEAGLERSENRKNGKVKKVRFCACVGFFILVLWTLLRMTEVYKSRCYLKNYLEGGWSEQITPVSGQTCAVAFCDCIQSSSLTAAPLSKS